MVLLAGMMKKIHLNERTPNVIFSLLEIFSGTQIRFKYIGYALCFKFHFHSISSKTAAFTLFDETKKSEIFRESNSDN